MLQIYVVTLKNDTHGCVLPFVQHPGRVGVGGWWGLNKLKCVWEGGGVGGGGGGGGGGNYDFSTKKKVCLL